MFSLNKMFSQKKKPAPKRNNFRPQLESLEKREVMSASSLALHAVTNGLGQNVAVFEGTSQTPANANGLIVSVNYLDDMGQEQQNSVIPTGIANTPNSVQSFSVGLDPNGAADIFVKATDGSFWNFDTGTQNWTKIQTPGNSQVESFAAVNGGRVYAIFQDNSLHQFNGGIWNLVYSSGRETALDAVTDKRGHDAVFIEGADKTFGEFYNPTGASLSVPAGQVYVGVYTRLANAGHFWNSTGTFSQVGAFSAGTDVNGYADVFATWFTGALEKDDYGSAWIGVAAPGAFESYSATDSGMAWIIGSNGTLERYNGSTFDSQFTSGGPERSIAAASSSAVFITFPNDEIEGFSLVWGGAAIGNTPF